MINTCNTLHCRETNFVVPIICVHVISSCTCICLRRTFLRQTGKCFTFIDFKQGLFLTHILSYLWRYFNFLPALCGLREIPWNYSENKCDPFHGWRDATILFCKSVFFPKHEILWPIYRMPNSVFKYTNFIPHLKKLYYKKTFSYLPTLNILET